MAIKTKQERVDEIDALLAAGISQSSAQDVSVSRDLEALRKERSTLLSQIAAESGRGSQFKRVVMNRRG